MRTMTASSSLSQVPVGASVVGPAEFSGDIGIHDFEMDVYDPYSPGESHAKPQAIGKLMSSTTLAARCQPTAGVATTAMLASQNTPAHYPFHTAQGLDHFEPRQCFYALSYQVSSDRKGNYRGLQWSDLRPDFPLESPIFKEYVFPDSTPHHQPPLCPLSHCVSSRTEPRTYIQRRYLRRCQLQ
jgi:hypothetical protein